ncbi:ATP-binding protein [Paracnuella aquatica]|uniref:DNA polymerase III subunit n=1 Tax=Paracnuella aquatica TaxID=2268757 RepID=UPI000DEFF6D9|nr:hypothetical protein [Paracnuella aquatica]RPD45976.1 hypothetical protein DRJ53_14435 [Paracnuella aquatica]
MLFSDVIGQQEVKGHLVEMVQHNRLSHALLFLGKEGSGALPLALAFAQYISSLPQQKGHSAEASLFGEATPPPALPSTPDEADSWTSQQSSFSKGQQMVHPDIHYAYPVITKKAGTPPLSTDYITEWREFVQQYPYGNVYDWLQFINAENKQGNITAAECNDIIRKLNLKSFESGYKVLVLWMPEYLGKEGNKLLKLIEEPPADTLFILVAESESAILSTILSRCQLVKVPALNPADVAAALQRRNGTPADAAQRIAGLSEGNYREALHLLQHADEDFSALLRDWLNATVKYQPQAQLKCIDDLARMGRENGKQFLRFFQHLLELALRLKVLEEAGMGHHLQGLPQNELDFAQRLNKICTVEQQGEISRELDDAAYYIERNANAKMLFHALTIKLFYIIRNNAVVEI